MDLLLSSLFEENSGSLTVWLCQTWLKQDKEPSSINYSTIWKHKLGLQHGGGLAFLIRNDVHYSQKVINVFNINSKVGVQAIKLQINSKLSIDMLNLHNLCENISCYEYDLYFKQLDTNAIIAGDFNSHHRMVGMWGPNNAAGVNLVDALILNPSITLLTPTSLPTNYNTATGTFSTLDQTLLTATSLPINYNTGTGTFSTLDLTFVSAQFYPISQVTVGKDIGSDHYPVIMAGALRPTIAKFKSRPKWKFESGSCYHWSKQLPHWINTLSIIKILMIHVLNL